MDYRAEFDSEAMEGELDKYSEEKRKLNTKVAQLQKEVNQLSQHSSARGAVEELRKQKRANEESYQLE